MAGLMLLGPALTHFAAAQQDPLSKLTGQIQSPRIAPSNPDLIAFGRLYRDAQELYLYNARMETVQRIQVPKDAATTPRPQSFTHLFEAQNLDQFSQYDGQLAWRPRLDVHERQWFAFVSSIGASFDIYLSYVDVQGRLSPDAPIRLPLEGLEQFPVWSPDGQALVFVSGDESGSDLYLASSMSAVLAHGPGKFRPVRLTADPALEAYPAWSPDGRYVAYQTLTSQEDRMNWGISLVSIADLDGGTAAMPVALTEELNDYDEFKPSWAPDGYHIAFYISQQRISREDDNLQQDIGVVGLVRSSSADRIVRGRLLSGFAPRLAANVIPHTLSGPVWAPDPDALLLVHVKRDAQALFPIYLTDFRRWQNKQAGYEQRLSTTFGTQYHRDPVLAALPSGTRVAFVSQEGNTNKLQVFDQPGPTEADRRLTIPVERSREAALVRSLFVPGLGQLYKGQRTKGMVLLLAEAASIGAGIYLISQVDPGRIETLEAAYKQSVTQPGGCPDGTGSPCQNAAFLAWQNEYDTARSRQTLAMAAFGAAAGLWVINVLDSALGFPHTVERPVRMADADVRLHAPQPHLTFRDGATHYGLRLSLDF